MSSGLALEHKDPGMARDSVSGIYFGHNRPKMGENVPCKSYLMYTICREVEATGVGSTVSPIDGESSALSAHRGHFFDV